MTGGGADIFAIVTSTDSGSGRLRDQIADFRSTVDQIDLHRIVGQQDFSGTSGFSGQGQAEVRYDRTAGILSGDGNGAADWQLSLGAGVALVVGDLIL